MNRIIYAKNAEYNNNFRTYFSVPVHIVKVLIKFHEDSPLNHFEKVVLSLLVHQNYTIKDLSETLMLKEDLIEYIMYNLKIKQFLYENNKITELGEKTITNQNSQEINEVGYILYDLNREVVFPKIIKANEFEIVYNRSNFLRIETDAYNENVKFDNVIIFKEGINNTNINDIIRRDLFKNSDKNISSINILKEDPAVYQLLLYLELNQEEFGNVWNVVNPFTKDYDVYLRDYLLINSKNKSIQRLIENITSFKKKTRRDNKGDEKLTDQVSNKLFNTKIKTEDELFVNPLIKVVQGLNQNKNLSYQDQVSNIVAIKDAMIHLGDLYEQILYTTASAYNSEFRDQCLKMFGRDRGLNIETLTKFAKDIGFDISDTGKRAFNVTRKSLSRNMSRSGSKRLQEVVSWNIALANNDKEHFFHEIVKNHPNLINLLFIFKETYRDENKHTVKTNVISPKVFIDLLWDLFELGLGYKVNKNELAKILETNNVIEDFIYSEEYIKTKIGPNLFKTNDKDLVELRTALIMMHHSYITEQSKYLQLAYSIVDAVLEKIVKKINETYKFKQTNIDDLFNSMEEIESFLIEKNFVLETNKLINNKVMDSLVYYRQQKRIENAFKNNFNKTVLRIKTLAVIMMLKQNEEILKSFKNYKNIFVITSKVNFLQKHHQVNEIDNKKAELVVEETIKLVDFFINDFYN